MLTAVGAWPPGWCIHSTGQFPKYLTNKFSLPTCQFSQTNCSGLLDIFLNNLPQMAVSIHLATFYTCGSLASHLVLAHVLVHRCVDASFPHPLPYLREPRPWGISAFSKLGPHTGDGELWQPTGREVMVLTLAASCQSTVSLENGTGRGSKHKTGNMLNISTSPRDKKKSVEKAGVTEPRKLRQIDTEQTHLSKWKNWK